MIKPHMRRRIIFILGFGFRVCGKLGRRIYEGEGYKRFLRGIYVGVVQYSFSQKQPFRRPFADLSRAFARSIFLRCATNLVQDIITCPVFDRFVECLEVLLGFYMVRGSK